MIFIPHPSLIKDDIATSNVQKIKTQIKILFGFSQIIVG
jgi:hypothetical protein